MKIPVNAAIDFCRAQLLALDVRQDIARAVAEHLVAADQAGYASHGMSILPRYRTAIADGSLQPDAEPRCVRDEGVQLAFEGDLGFGQYVGRKVFDAAIERAREGALCALTLRHTHHLGRMGHYGEQVAAAGLVLLAFTNVIGRTPMVAPFSGSQPRLTTDPLCFAIPLGDGRDPFVLDMATSQVALNKVRVLSARGETVPPGALIDAAGQPTVDGNVMFSQTPGALLPFGGHKGYGLGLATELLAGLLTGGGTIQPAHQQGASLATNNLFALVIDPARFANPGWITAEAQAYIDYLLKCPPQPGAGAVQYPGEYEANNRRLHADYIELDTPTLTELAKLAEALGTDAPQSVAA